MLIFLFYSLQVHHFFFIFDIIRWRDTFDDWRQHHNLVIVLMWQVMTPSWLH